MTTTTYGQGRARVLAAIRAFIAQHGAIQYQDNQARTIVIVEK